MELILHPSEARGKASFGWLNTRYSFSFANYYNPDKVHFGTLRVLNDDIIAGGAGFDLHPHDNMEIITIVLDGVLRHTDSMKHTETIQSGEVQVMSAGTGIFHAEYNNLPDKALSLFQIWIFPNQKNLKPRYDQRFFDPEKRKNKWQTIVDPTGNEGLMIHQQAWISRTDLIAGQSLAYQMHQKNQGVFLMNITGRIRVENQGLGERDAIGIWNGMDFLVNAEQSSEVLAIEVPMS